MTHEVESGAVAKLLLLEYGSKLVGIYGSGPSNLKASPKGPAGSDDFGQMTVKSTWPAFSQPSLLLVILQAAQNLGPNSADNGSKRRLLRKAMGDARALIHAVRQVHETRRTPPR